MRTRIQHRFGAIIIEQADCNVCVAVVKERNSGDNIENMTAFQNVSCRILSDKYGLETEMGVILPALSLDSEFDDTFKPSS